MFYKKMSVALGFLAIVTSANANNFQWKPIANDDKGQPVIGVDYSRSFNSDGMPIVFWNDFRHGDRFKFVDNPNLKPMSIFRSKIDCKNRLILPQYVALSKARHFFDSDPTIYESHDGVGKWNWSVPDPGSSQEFVMKFFCGIK